MTLWTEPPRIRQLRTLDEFPSPGLDALGAAATQALYDSPSWQIRRRLEDARARDPYVWEYDESGARIIGDKPIVDKATAIAKAKEQGVDLTIPDTGVTEDYLALQIKRKKEYQQRQDIMARSPKGLLFGTAEFTTGLAASMLDPLNIAASFIPVGRLVAPAMAARAETAATLGQRTMARAGVGAIEGTAGQALVEPLTAFSYSQEQLDYTLINSLQNIAFGAILGSAAHTGFGLIRDKLGPRPQTQFQKLMDNLDPTVKINALKAEVANIVEGRNGDIAPVLRPFVKDETFNIVEAPDAPVGREGYDAPITVNAKTLLDIVAEDRPEPFVLDSQKAMAIRNGEAPAENIEIAISQPASSILVDRGLDRLAVAAETGEAVTVYLKKQDIENLQARMDAMAARKRTQEPNPVDMDAVARAAEQRYALENNKYADIQALNELDAMPVKDDAVLLKEQADDMMAEAQMHAEQLGFDLPELKQLADIDAKATQYAKAVKAAAVCGIRG